MAEQALERQPQQLLQQLPDLAEADVGDAVLFLTVPYIKGTLWSLIKGSIKGMVIPGGLSLDDSKLIDLVIFHSLWVYGALGHILTSTVPNFHVGKKPVA